MEQNDLNQQHMSVGEMHAPSSVIPNVLARLGLRGLDVLPEKSLDQPGDALHSGAWYVRAAAVRALMSLGKQAPIEPLVEALKDKDETVRALAVRALGGLEERAPVEQLVVALADDAWIVREAAVLALGELGERAEPLVKVLDDEDVSVRTAVAWVFQQTPFSTLPMLLSNTTPSLEQQPSGGVPGSRMEELDHSSESRSDAADQGIQKHFHRRVQLPWSGWSIIARDKKRERMLDQENDETIPRLGTLPADQQEPVIVKHRISRRRVLGGAAALLVVAAQGIIWYELAQSRRGASPTSSTGETSPSPDLLSLGTTVYVYHDPRNFPVQDAVWSPDGKRVASADGAIVQIWDALTGKHVVTHRPPIVDMAFYQVAWSPNGKYLASTGKNNLGAQVWEAATGRSVLIGQVPPYGNWGITWSPNGKYIATGDAGSSSVTVWEIATQKSIFTKHIDTGDPEDFVYAVAWSPDGKYIASGGSDQKVHVWEAFTGKVSITHSGQADVMYIAWSPSGKRIASAGGDNGNMVQIWDPTTGKQILTYSGHSSFVNSVSWSPNGRYVASASADKTVQIWNATTGKHIFTYRGHDHSDNKTGQTRQNARTGVLTSRNFPPTVFSARWSPDGHYIASASMDETVRVWRAL